MTSDALKSIQPVIGSINKLAANVEKLSTQIVNTPVKYTLAGAAFLTANTAGGAGFMKINAIPSWAGAGDVWVVIDAGTTEAEIRKLGSVSGDYYTVLPVLDYAHAEGDTVIFLSAPIANVRHWGALGDDSADDLIPFQRACAQAAYVYPMSVYIPAGTYRVSGAITVRSRTEVFGDGKNVSIVRATNNSSANTFEANGTSISYLTDVTFRDFGITTAISTGDAVLFSYVNGATVDNVYAYGFTVGINVFSCNKSVVTRCYAENCTSAGIRVAGTGTQEIAANIANNTTSTCELGFSISTIAGATITGNAALSSTTYGFLLTGMTLCSFAGNVAGGSGTASVRLTGTATIAISLAGNCLTDTVKISHDLSVDTRIFNDDAWSDYIASNAMSAGTGSPLSELVDSIKVWTLQDSTSDQVCSWYAAPLGFTRDFIGFRIHYTAASATTGNFRIRLTTKILYSDQNHVNVVGGGGTDEFNCPVSSTLNRVMVTAAPATYLCAGGAVMGLKLTRLGSDGNDSATGNMWLHGIQIVRAGW